MSKKQKKDPSVPQRIKRADRDRRQIFTFDHFFNPENEKRMNTQDRRHEMNRPKINLGNIFL